MPLKKISINNIVVVEKKDNKRCFGIGEAWRKGDPLPLSRMNAAEREDMLLRLESSIAYLMDDANIKYQAYNTNDSMRALDYIVRLSTNEFFFYTKEALTLQEFQVLQNKIAEKAKSLPSGVQLILGSFAVKTADNKLMNVTPHITCGQQPVFNFIIKNHTSSVDIAYTEIDNTGRDFVLDTFDVESYVHSMPAIIVNGVRCTFTFNNIVYCKTPGGTTFITAIDICVDHLRGVAKKNLQSMLMKKFIMLPISYVIVSNYVEISKNNCIGCNTVHVDPHGSPQQCVEDTMQIAEAPKKLPFGNNDFIMYNVTSVHFQALQNSYAYKMANRRHFFKADARNCSIEYLGYRGDDLKSKILDDFKSILETIHSLNKLNMLQRDIMHIREYKVLATGQGICTRLFRLKTSSVKALEQMFAAQRNNIEK